MNSKQYLAQLLQIIHDLETVGNDETFIRQLFVVRRLYSITLQAEAIAQSRSNYQAQGLTCGWCHKRVKTLDHVVQCRTAAQKLETDAIESTKVKLQNLLEEL